MANDLLVAIGTRSGKADTWIQSLPERFPFLGIRTVDRENLPALGPAQDDEKDHATLVVSRPYASISEFRKDMEIALQKGWEVYLEYFPGEPLVQLLRNEERMPSKVGAAELRTDLQQLQKEADYWAVLDVLVDSVRES